MNSLELASFAIALAGFSLNASALNVSALNLLPKRSAETQAELDWSQILEQIEPRLGPGQGALGEFDKGRVIAHCVFSAQADEKFENIEIRVFKNSSLGTSLRSAEIVRTDVLGNEVSRKDIPYVFSKRVRKESAGPFGEAFTAAQLLGITQADSIMFYGVDMNFSAPVGLAVVHDVDDDPIDHFALLGQKIYRCEGREDAVRGCVQR